MAKVGIKMKSTMCILAVLTKMTVSEFYRGAKILSFTRFSELVKYKLEDVGY